MEVGKAGPQEVDIPLALGDFPPKGIKLAVTNVPGNLLCVDVRINNSVRMNHVAFD
jgi:hypothetical protein